MKEKGCKFHPKGTLPSPEWCKEAQEKAPKLCDGCTVNVYKKTLDTKSPKKL